MNKPEIVSITQPLVEGFSAEEYIAHVARVSNPENQFNNETAGKLLVHLLKKQHWSPFDMVDLTFKIETSKAVAIQILRHNSFRFQEFSQRYSEVKSLDYSHVEIRKKAIGGNRQGSGERMDKITKVVKGLCDKIAHVYNYCLDFGAAPESARMLLPMATPTTLYMKGSIRSWITYFWVRCHKDSQKEHRELALQMLELFCEKFPLLGGVIKSNRPQIVEQDWINEP